MPTITYAIIFASDNGYGWTEKHQQNNNSDTPNLNVQLNAFEQGVVVPRASMLGEDCKVVGMRASFPRVGAVASLNRRKAYNGLQGQPSSEPSTSLAVQWVESTYTQTKITHLRGFPDAVESDGSFQPGGSAEFNTAFNLYKNNLIQGQYGWSAKNAATSAKGVADSYVQQANGTVTVSLEGPGIPVAWYQQIVPIRFSGFNYRKSPMNRSILCYVNSAFSVTTVQPIGVGPCISKGKYNFRGVGFRNYFDTSSITLGRRPMGKPLNRLPGRSGVIPRY